MFTGIIQALRPVTIMYQHGNILRLGVSICQLLKDKLELGASMAINGVCLTVISLENDIALFDVIPETQKKTALSFLKEGSFVNIERAASLGGEIGGHFVSGHVWGTVPISALEEHKDFRVLQCQISKDWTKYLFPKGFIALDGVSLTLVDVDPEGFFTVHLIPETLKRTTLGIKQVGSSLNIEFDTHAQVLVDTVERLLSEKDFPDSQR